jgi:hypothetical protein
MLKFLKNESTLMLVLLALIVVLIWAVFFKRESYELSPADESVIISDLVNLGVTSNVEHSSVISALKAYPKDMKALENLFLNMEDENPSKPLIKQYIITFMVETDKKINASRGITSTKMVGDPKTVMMEAPKMGGGVMEAPKMGGGVMEAPKMGGGVKTGVMGDRMDGGMKTGMMGGRKRYAYQPESFKQWAMNTLGLDKEQLLIVTTLADGISLSLIPVPTQTNLRSLLGSRMRGEQINSVYERFTTMAFAGATPGKYLNAN